MGQRLGRPERFQAGLKSLSRGSVVLSCWLLILLAGCGNEKTAEVPVNEENCGPVIRYGLDWNYFLPDSGEVREGQTLSALLSSAGLDNQQIAQAVDATRGVWDVRDLRVGKPWWSLHQPDSTFAPVSFVYQGSLREYVQFHFGDSIWVEKHQFPVDTVRIRATGTIESSLYVDLDRIGAPAALALSMANVYAWTIDFTRLQAGDAFDVFYEVETVNGEPVSSPKILASHFTHRSKLLTAYRFDGGSGPAYYNADGESLRRAFLKSPVEFSRISSRYNLKRFHPVLNRVKAHLGTDYAAPHGTPIIAVGDGVVSKSEYHSGNGNYVKIRHNSTYETQYLHMSKRAVSAGQRVHQGQVIGYVGSTGLSTGPHVCFRFWKNGRQVDHLSEESPASEPISKKDRPAFEQALREMQGWYAEGD